MKTKKNEEDLSFIPTLWIESLNFVLQKDSVNSERSLIGIIISSDQMIYATTEGFF